MRAMAWKGFQEIAAQHGASAEGGFTERSHTVAFAKFREFFEKETERRVIVSLLTAFDDYVQTCEDVFMDAEKV